MKDIAAKLQEIRAHAANHHHHNNVKENNRNFYQRQVHLNDDQQHFKGDYQNNDEEDDDEDHFQQDKFLLDSAAYPSYFNRPMDQTDPIYKTMSVSTPNGTFSVKKSAPVTIKLPTGLVKTAALVYPAMKSSLISPLPIIGQQVHILLLESKVAVLPPQHPITHKAVQLAKKIATVSHGLYQLDTSTNIKKTHYENRTLPVDRPKLCRKTLPSRPIDTVIIPTAKQKRTKSIPIGLSTKPTKCPNLKVELDKRHRQFFFDYHLLFNHA